MISPVATLVQLLDEYKGDLDFILWNLRRLNKECPLHWYQIAPEINRLEAIADSSEGECRKGMSLLLSQVYFHLEEYPKAMKAACDSQDWFIKYLDAFYNSISENMEDDASSPAPEAKEYVDKMVTLCVDQYIAYNSTVIGSGQPPTSALTSDLEPKSPENLESLVKYIMCLDKAAELPESILKLLLGIALESENEEYVDKILRCDPLNLMRYTMASHELLLSSKKLQQTVFPMVSKLYKTKFYNESDVLKPQDEWLQYADELPNYFQALCMCGQADEIATLFRDLIATGNDKNVLRVYQLAFDLFTFGSQSLLKNVRQHPRLACRNPPSGQTGNAPPMPSPTTPPPNSNEPDEGTKTTDLKTEEDSVLERVNAILTGGFQARVLLKFSNAQNKTDLGILETLMQNMGSRYPILQTMLIVTHSFMQRGTTCDTFLRLNLEWFSKPTLWGKFISTASLGVVHQTHNDKSFRVLSTYLPGIPGWSPGSSYTDGGALYALGLIHANMATDEVIKYLLGQLSGRSDQPNAGERSVNEVIQYGASLALGLTAMGSGDIAVSEALEAVLMMDSAIAGEAAALGLGLVNIGSCSEQLIESLLTYAEETRHEKIIRACGLGVAFTCIQMQEQAAPFIDRMLKSTDPLIRYGGCFALGLAYVGTAKKSALRNLLHIAVSDPVDDVRQGAVLSISFLLSNCPDQAPKIFKFLADSFNFRVRFAAVLGLGMTCAGSASTEALQIIKAATKDAHDLVRQAAFISLGLVLIECPEKIGVDRSPDSESPMQIRHELVNVALDAREDSMARVGAIIGLGIIDGGGRNCNISMAYRENLVGVTANLKLPAKFQVHIGTCPPSMFAYPPKFERENKDKQVKITTSLLSAALRAGTRLPAEPEKPKEPEVKTSDSAEAQIPEPTYTTIANGQRIIPMQLPMLKQQSFTSERFTPIFPRRKLQNGGIVVLVDNQMKESDEEYIME